MEYVLLLVLVVVSMVIRSRDRRRREMIDAELLNRLEALNARVRVLEFEKLQAARSIPPQAVPATSVQWPTPPQPTVPAIVAPPSAPEISAAAPQLRPLSVAGDVKETAAVDKRDLFGIPISTPPDRPIEAPVEAPAFKTQDQEQAVPAHRVASLEEKLGANWLNKLGIVILVFGVAFFLAYQLRTLGPLGKIVVGFAVSGTLLVGGLFLERRDKYRILARAGIGGGWALTFFTAYAMYHVPATRVLSSQAIDLVLMILIAIGMVWHSLRYKSQVVTGLGFLLAFSTVTISQVTVFSLVAGAVLAGGLVYVTSREHWAELEVAGLVGVYLNHFLWLDRILRARGGPGHPFPEFFPSAGLILLYWLIFRVAYAQRIPRDDREDLLTSITAVLNSAGVLGLLKYQSAHPEWAFWALLALGAAEMLLAFYARPLRRTAFIVLSSIGSALLLAAIPFRYRGAHWSVLWLLEVEVLFISGIRMREAVFRRLGMLAGFAAAFQLIAREAVPVFSLRAVHADAARHWSTALALACGATIYWFNSEAAPRRWPQIAATDADSISLRVMSYFGLPSAAAALWVFFPGNQTVVAWMVLAIALGVAADQWNSSDLALQCDLLSAASFVRVIVINLPSASRWMFAAQRTITVTVVSGLFYLGTRRKKDAGNLNAAYIPIAYSWTGSILLALLVWYELLPVSVAVGWGVLGLLLFETGILRNRAYLRYQGLLILAASFVRIFFVNLNAGGSGQLLSPRIYTALPLIAAYLWAYERLRQSGSTPFDRIAQNAAACCGTIALAAVVYFEVRTEWVVIAWAVLVLLLLGVAWMLNRRLFLVQGVVLTIAVFARALLFNLSAATMVGSSLLHGRVACVGIASAILLIALTIAFRLRRRDEVVNPSDGWIGWAKLVISRPEQLLFFAPLLLTTIMLAREMRAGMITVTWSALGVGVFLLALLVHERSYRFAGLGLLLLGVGKILFVDIWHLAPTDRYITLIVMGIALLLVSFLYTRYRETILKFL
jgi:uncharacterized membrane protein